MKSDYKRLDTTSIKMIFPIIHMIIRWIQLKVGTLILVVPTGLLAIPATVGTFAFCWGTWWVGKKLFGKNEREKWYYEYNID